MLRVVERSVLLFDSPVSLLVLGVLLVRYVARTWQNVVLDMGNATSIDSTGLQVRLHHVGWVWLGQCVCDTCLSSCIDHPRR